MIKFFKAFCTITVTIFVLILAISSCGGRTPPVGPVPIDIGIKGSINPPNTNPNNVDLFNLNEQQGESQERSLFEALQGLSVEKINQLTLSQLETQGINTQNVKPPIRGINAQVLSRVIASANGERTLFDNQNNKVFAVESNGDIIAQADVASDGSFELNLEEKDIEGKDVALVFAEEIDGKLICKQPIEIDPSPEEEQEGEDDNEILVVNSAKLQQSALSTQQNGSEVDLGNLGFNPETGSPDNINAESITPVVNNQFKEDSDGNGVPDFIESCSTKAGAVNPHLRADFTWDMPPNQQESFLYDYGLAIAFDKDKGLESEEFSVSGTSGVDGEGNLDMSVMKLADKDQKVALAVMDEAYIAPNRATYPLTPFFDVNAALDTQAPFKTLDEDDITQNFQLDEDNPLIKGMGLVTGIVTNTQGNPVENSTVIGVLNSDEVLDFSMDITNSSGEYELLLPALSSTEFAQYTILAVDPNGTLTGRKEQFIDQAKEFQINITLQ